MTDRKWLPKMTVENLEWKVAFHEHQGRYEAAKALRDLFDIELSESNINALKKSFERWDEK